MHTTHEERETMPIHLVTIRNSTIADFRTCREKWHLRHVEQLVPIKHARALTVGGIAHEGFAACYRELKRQRDEGCISLDVTELRSRVQSHMEATLSKWRESIEANREWMNIPQEEQIAIVAESEEVARESMTAVRLFVRAFALEDWQRFKVLEVERAFDVPLVSSVAFPVGRHRADGTRRMQKKTANGIRSAGTRDAVLQDIDSGQVVLVEHKTTKGRADRYDARFDVDPQPRQYVHALMTEGHANAGRVIYNVVSKSAPRSPEVNKDGKVSVAKCDTLAELYERALVAQEVERGITRTEKQIEMLAGLPRATDRWAQRYEFFVGEREIEQWRTELAADGVLMRKAMAGHLPITRNGASCSLPWQPPCPMRGACVDREAHAKDYETPAQARAREEGTREMDEVESWLGF